MISIGNKRAKKLFEGGSLGGHTFEPMDTAKANITNKKSMICKECNLTIRVKRNELRGLYYVLITPKYMLKIAKQLPTCSEVKIHEALS